MLLHTASTFRASSVRSLVSLASVLPLSLWGFDVTQAYLYIGTSVAREVYIEPPVELGFRTDEILRVVKALYGLSDVRNYWQRRLRDMLQYMMGMRTSP